MAELKPVSADPYDAVLADLRSQRDELDTTIRMLETARDRRLGVASPALASADQPVEIENAAGQFLGMSIVDATKSLLKSRKRKLNNSEILKELKAGGVVLTGADPLNVVGSVLTRRFNNVGDIVRVDRGTWGLKEWYPGRNFKASAPKPASLTLESVEGVPNAYEVRINDLGGDHDKDDDL